MSQEPHCSTQPPWPSGARLRVDNGTHSPATVVGSSPQHSLPGYSLTAMEIIRLEHPRAEESLGRLLEHLSLVPQKLSGVHEAGRSLLMASRKCKSRDDLEARYFHLCLRPAQATGTISPHQSVFPWAISSQDRCLLCSSFRK